MRCRSSAVVSSALVAALLGLLAAGPAARAAATDRERVSSWALYHAVVAPDREPAFEQRASVTLTVPADGGAASFEIHNVEAAASAVVRQLLDDVATTPQLRYQVKLVPDDGGGDRMSRSQPAVATVPACNVVRSNFRDELVLSLDPEAHVLSLAYLPLVSPLAPPTCGALDPPPVAPAAGFESRVAFELAAPGMPLRTVLPPLPKPPPGLRFLPRARGANGALPGGGPAGPDQPEPMTGPLGFLKRYWYIIVPLLLMNLFAAPPPEEEESERKAVRGDGGGATAADAGSARGAAAAAAAATPAPGGGATGTPGSSPKRRGKRG